MKIVAGEGKKERNFGRSRGGEVGGRESGRGGCRSGEEGSEAVLASTGLA